MSNENNVQMTEAEKSLVEKLLGEENIFLILSRRTMRPFVVCDSETFDDEVLLYTKPEYVHEVLKRLTEENNPVDVGVIVQNERLNFFANMCTMGVNCIVLNHGTEEEGRIQLDRLVRTPKGKTPDGQPWIENPELHLTAAYFMQMVARCAGKEMSEEATKELSEMREEIIAHYSNGNFIIYFNDKGQLPIMRFPNGDAYQPVFTDLFEASKFKIEGEPKKAAVVAAKIPALLAPEAKGVIVNPTGVGLQLPIIRQALKPQQNPAPTENPNPTPEN